MERCTFRVAAPLSVVKDIKALAEEQGGVCSAPQPASSTAEALNAPISGGDIQAAAEVLTVVFTAGSAGVKFVESLWKLVETRNVRIKASNVQSQTIRTL